MICRLCLTEKSKENFQVIKNKGIISGRRKICKKCRFEKYRRSKNDQKEASKASYYKSMESPEKREKYNARHRNYRLKRKNEGNPIVRNCKSDKYRKTGRFKFFIRAEVFRLKGNDCYYCKSKADQIDHVIPLVSGGTDDITNLVPACRSCNSSKQDMPLAEWLKVRKEGYLYRNSLR